MRYVSLGGCNVEDLALNTNSDNIIHLYIYFFFFLPGKELNEALNARINEFLQSYKAAADEKHPGLAALYSNLLFAKVPVERLFPSHSS